MKRNIIKIESKAVIVTTAPTGNYIDNELGNGIWMTVWEIADIFNVSGTAVVSAIKAIRKADILNDYEVCKYICLDNGNTADVYSLEMIIPIAFRSNDISQLCIVNIFGTDLTRALFSFGHSIDYWTRA